MKTKIRFAVAGLAVLSVFALAACKGGGPSAPAAGGAGGDQAGAEKASSESQKTIYHCPMHPTVTSDKPGDCPICGMRLVPIAQEEKPASAPAPAKKKTMYRSTMNPGEVSDKPGKDSMGMDMVPFEVEETGTVTEVGGRIRVSISAQRQQLIGVKTAKVARLDIHRLINAVGHVDYAEPNISFVNLKFEGWVEKLYVDSTGRPVRKGEPLFDLYSPDLLAAEQEYLIALKAGASLGEASSLLKSSREKLRLWNVTDAQIEELAKTGEVKRTLAVYAPGSGIVIEKSVVQGQKIMAGENLYKIADLSTVWILGEVYEYELPFLKVGQEVKAALSYYPGETFGGRISYIYPYLKPETRTNPVRVEVRNPGLKLKPEMFANLEINVDYGTKLAVPADAILDSGGAKMVFVTAGDGYFEPREVKLGVKGQDVYEVLGGVMEGESVVTSANFLVDSESSLKAALSRMTKAAAGEAKHD